MCSFFSPTDAASFFRSISRLPATITSSGLLAFFLAQHDDGLVDLIDRHADEVRHFVGGVELSSRRIRSVV